VSGKSEQSAYNRGTVYPSINFVGGIVAIIISESKFPYGLCRVQGRVSLLHVKADLFGATPRLIFPYMNRSHGETAKKRMVSPGS
jgi:hypothetical protein